ncbi:TfoX/Sxy family DNA transformation protein [Aestuariibius sp. HNIBRBA575]|uniref:TfoX/Sxy family DNA transformation protein n=1 Tax=Aestuariibius sp. HNIBRBA575 TaxID=3233343 RepID=UPI0034A18F0D
MKKPAKSGKGSPVTSIMNLGPATEKLFAKHGFHTAQDIIDIGADQAYAQMTRSGLKPNFIGYYGLVLGLQGRPWTDCFPAEKAELRRKFDLLKAQNHDADRDELETILSDIGVVGPPKR